jgi:hypothetical protein
MKLVVALLLFGLYAGADDGFVKWWPQFQAAVAKNDQKAILRGASYPMDWELGKVRKINSEVDFLAHFDAYFTADMKKAVASKKPVAIPNNQYMITWNARGNEYSMYFLAKDGGYVLHALSEGPP